MFPLVAALFKGEKIPSQASWNTTTQPAMNYKPDQVNVSSSEGESLLPGGELFTTNLINYDAHLRGP